jgi:hypothetical protein
VLIGVIWLSFTYFAFREDRRRTPDPRAPVTE